MRALICLFQKKALILQRELKTPRKDGRVVEGAALEMRYTPHRVSGVRIPLFPQKFLRKQGDSHSSGSHSTLRRFRSRGSSLSKAQVKGFLHPSFRKTLFNPKHLARCFFDERLIENY